MKFNKANRGGALTPIVAIIAVVILILAVSYLTSGPGEESPIPASVNGAPVMTDTTPDDSDPMPSEPTTGGAAILDFSQLEYDAALQSHELVVLFFYASWCPLCQEEFPRMQEVFGELDGSKVIGFRVNFNDSSTDDNEEELAREFGVAYQHTKVFVQNGERVLKSPETWTNERYLEEINSVLGL